MSPSSCREGLPKSSSSLLKVFFFLQLYVGSPNVLERTRRDYSAHMASIYGFLQFFDEIGEKAGILIITSSSYISQRSTGRQIANCEQWEPATERDFFLV
jgi:hypothetical protein